METVVRKDLQRVRRGQRKASGRGWAESRLGVTKKPRTRGWRWSLGKGWERTGRESVMGKGTGMVPASQSWQLCQL